MNYLAHQHLSADDLNLKIGNFIADHIRGNHFENFPKDIVKGIYLHRAIDAFTDTHPYYKAAKNAVYPTLSRWSGVAVDIYFDHFLAKNWDNYHAIPLLTFTKNTYGIMLSAAEWLPESAKYMLGFMEHQNWLYNYGNFEGLSRSFLGLHKRVKSENLLHLAPMALMHAYDTIEHHFISFYPEVQRFSANWIKSNFEL